jgi:hypothetical protein
VSDVAPHLRREFASWIRFDFERLSQADYCAERLSEGSSTFVRDLLPEGGVCEGFGQRQGVHETQAVGRQRLPGAHIDEHEALGEAPSQKDIAWVAVNCGQHV